MTDAATLNRTVEVGSLSIANDRPFVLIAGPCALESRAHALETSHALVELTRKLGIGLIYKSSFDKANRTSLAGRRGLGMEEGLRILTDVRDAVGCPTLTDVHGPDQCGPAAEAVDVIQIPAFLCRQTDLLLAADYAAHEAGFAAAQSVAGGSAALYHLDARDPDRPRARPLREEIARVVHARAANPAWVDGMLRHGFRGGAEIAATLDHLGAFAHLADAVSVELIDLYFDATLARETVVECLEAANPAALAAMRARFAALHAANLWPTRRNSILAQLGMPA